MTDRTGQVWEWTNGVAVLFTGPPEVLQRGDFVMFDHPILNLSGGRSDYKVRELLNHPFERSLDMQRLA